MCVPQFVTMNQIFMWYILIKREENIVVHNNDTGVGAP